MAIPTDENLETILELLIEEFFAERGCLWIEEEQKLLYKGDEQLKNTFPFSGQIVREALATERGFVSFDSLVDERIHPTGSIHLNGVRSCLCAAARNQKGQVLAIAYFDNRTSGGNFSQADLDFLNDVLALYPSDSLPDHRTISS